MEYPETQPQAGDLEALLPTLADAERRRILTYLQNSAAETVSLDELTTHLTTDSERNPEHTRIRLHHNHLPTLAARAIIDYDPRTKTIRYAGHSRLESLLDTIHAHQAP